MKYEKKTNYLVDPQEIGKMIHDSRKALGLSQTEAAVLVGMKNYQQFSRIERGDAIPRKETLERVCKALNLCVDDFIVVQRIASDRLTLMEQIKKASKWNQVGARGGSAHMYPGSLEHDCGLNPLEDYAIGPCPWVLYTRRDMVKMLESEGHQISISDELTDQRREEEWLYFTNIVFLLPDILFQYPDIELFEMIFKEDQFRQNASALLDQVADTGNNFPKLNKLKNSIINSTYCELLESDEVESWTKDFFEKRNDPEGIKELHRYVTNVSSELFYEWDVSAYKKYAQYHFISKKDEGYAEVEKSHQWLNKAWPAACEMINNIPPRIGFYPDFNICRKLFLGRLESGCAGDAEV